MTSNYERFGIVDADMEHNRKMRSILTVRRFHYAEERDDIEAALGLGNDALGGGLVSADTVEACQSWTGRCFFVRKSNTGQTEGFIGLLHLTQDGVNALMQGVFRPGAPDLHHLAERGQPAKALYAWCVAANNEEAKRATVRASILIRRLAFNHIPLFANPMSREGLMLIASLDKPDGKTSWLGWFPQKHNDTDTLNTQLEKEGLDGRIPAE